MEITPTYRATMHAGRCHMENGRSTGLVFSNKHNDRNYDVAGADNINAELVKENLYYIADEHCEIIPKPANITFESWELKMYNHYYGDWLEKQPNGTEMQDTNPAYELCPMYSNPQDKRPERKF